MQNNGGNRARDCGRRELAEQATGGEEGSLQEGFSPLERTPEVCALLESCPPV